MSAATMAPVPRADQPLDAVLGPIHEDWLAEAHRLLEPAMAPASDFWARWVAVRYICDDFQTRYQRERALLDELRPFLPPDTAERLRVDGDRVFQLRLQLDRIGRRRGTATEFATGAQALLEQLGAWCAAIELAAAGIARGILPIEAAELLGHLETHLRLPR